MASVGQQRDLLISLGMLEDNKAKSPHPDFDGGVRQTDWWDPDPARSHDRLVLDLMLGRKEGRP